MSGFPFSFLDPRPATSPYNPGTPYHPVALTSGTRLGAYEILSLLGSGGMGEVYRAKDTQLGRDVALKILSDSFAHEPDRLARFRREAQVLASLNHPHIGAIYGLDESNTIQFLALELVDGESLDRRIARGKIPVDDALAIAKQIAEALEAAHEQGIIHRDLKPANIKVRSDGMVKVLDFGLAKALDPAAGSSPSLSMSPTITTPAMTQAGIIFGTAAYMSPEQARGKLVDRRTDIWAFGVVLFEMLTGKRAFEAEDVSLTLAEVMKSEPDWSALPSSVPPALQLYLRRCLVKDPRQRVRDIGDVRLAIEGAFDTEMSAGTPPSASLVAPRWWKRALPAVVASVLFAMLVAIAGWSLKPVPPSVPVTRFAITIPPQQALTTSTRHMVAISPDGTRIAYVANNQLYLRTMSELEARPVPGSELSKNGSIYDPAFSPDGRSIAFWTSTDQSIKWIAITGGAAVTVCQARVTSGISWTPDGIVFAEGTEGVMRVGAAGGTPQTIVRMNSGERADGPQLLPGGQWVLFAIAPSANQWDKAQIVAQSLKSGERKLLIAGGSDPRYIPVGYLVYALSGVLFAVSFDAQKIQITGGPVSVLEGVRRSAFATTGAAQFATSATGVLVYQPGPVATTTGNTDLALFDPTTGAATHLNLGPGTFDHPRVSPDGKQITFATDDGTEAVVWVYDLFQSTAARRLAFIGKNRFPIWSADGQHIVFQSDRERDLGIWWQRADGTGTASRLTKAEQGASHIPESWRPGSDLFLYSVAKGAMTLWTYSVHDGKTALFDNVRSTLPINAVFSPDGLWVAYSSDQVSPESALYVQPFPPTGFPYRVSQGPGLQPLWSPDGTAIFFNPGPGQYMKASISRSPVFRWGNGMQVPRPFVTGGPAVIRNHDMMPDGKILGSTVADNNTTSESTASQLQVVLNWNEELKQRVAAR